MVDGVDRLGNGGYIHVIRYVMWISSLWLYFEDHILRRNCVIYKPQGQENHEVEGKKVHSSLSDRVVAVMLL
jgi:hypothetical protein